MKPERVQDTPPIVPRTVQLSYRFDSFAAASRFVAELGQSLPGRGLEVSISDSRVEVRLPGGAAADAAREAETLQRLALS